ncbi:MAG: HPr(Ser) kinase/phosphatase [Lachnospiraceae bacterium]|nr:HPr(Ser) kinase/phosphatase [Lachnospiraceae bacterium]
MYSVSMEKFVREFELTEVLPDVKIEDKKLIRSEINRPALQITGFFEHFDSDRIQIIGKVEYSYLLKMDPKLRDSAFERICSLHIPCIVLCNHAQPVPEMIKHAREYSIPIFSTPNRTSYFMSEAIRWLNSELAERITIHGVLVDVYGVGILIIGESGVGKSETALELIKRGHRLVADDAVEIKKISHNKLTGSCPEIIRYFIELRGIGIVNVKELFGVGSIKETQTIDLVIKLEMWNGDAEHDRLGLNDEYMEIMGNKIVCNSIPIRPGRNLAVICEAAAINHRQKMIGYNAAYMLDKRLRGDNEI